MANSGNGDARTLMQFEANKRSVGVAYLLWLFLGGLGAHRFYTGRVLSGLAMFLLLVLALGTAGASLIVLALWCVLDAFLIPGWVRRENLKLVDRLAPLPKHPKLDWKSGDAKSIAGTTAALAAALGLIMILASKQQQSPAPSPITTASITKTEPSKTHYFTAPSLKLSPARVEGPSQPQPDQWAPTVAAAEARAAAPPSSRPRTPSPAERGATIGVPTDLKASYSVESVSKTKAGMVRIISKRIGPSGTSYSHRECNCAKSTFRYIGDGETVEAMNARKPDTAFTKLVGNNGQGSVSYHVCAHACTTVKTVGGRAKP